MRRPPQVPVTERDRSVGLAKRRAPNIWLHQQLTPSVGCVHGTHLWRATGPRHDRPAAAGSGRRMLLNEVNIGRRRRKPQSTGNSRYSSSCARSTCDADLTGSSHDAAEHMLQAALEAQPALHSRATILAEGRVDLYTYSPFLTLPSGACRSLSGQKPPAAYRFVSVALIAVIYRVRSLCSKFTG